MRRPTTTYTAPRQARVASALLGCAVALGGCSPETGTLETTRSAVRNGTVDTGDPAVAAVGLRPPRCESPAGVMCTATLIAPRVLLSAAHCFPPIPGAEFVAFFGGDVSGAGIYRTSLEVQRHPEFNDQTNDNDLALILLDEAVSLNHARAGRHEYIRGPEGRVAQRPRAGSL